MPDEVQQHYQRSAAARVCASRSWNTSGLTLMGICPRDENSIQLQPSQMIPQSFQPLSKGS